MKFLLEIEMDNAAFEIDPDGEVIKLLEDSLRYVPLIIHGFNKKNGCYCNETNTHIISDSNGNTVGSMAIVE